MRHIRIKLIPLEWQSSILIGIRMTRSIKSQLSLENSHRVVCECLHVSNHFILSGY